MSPRRRQPVLRVEAPAWVEELVEWERPYAGEEARVRLAVRLARENVLRGGGGPFGAVVFDSSTGLPVAAGVNLVVPLRNSVLHAETVALMLAQARLGSFTLAAEGLPPHELAASCDPCAMCLGAVLWSGVRRLLCGADRADAEAVGFDEGPVTPAAYEHLRGRGIAVRRGVLREEAREVLQRYRSGGGLVYNG